MQMKPETQGFTNTCYLASITSVFLIAATLLVYFLLPGEYQQKTVDNTTAQNDISNLAKTDEKSDTVFSDFILTDEEDELSLAFQDYLTEVALTKYNTNSDDGLLLYRQQISKGAVEWFYYQITGNKNVTQAILLEAEKNDIPLSLAFALAHAESNYKPGAVNNNSNSSIDRGLFQLNSNSFAELSEEDFFDPFVSARYGMSHLKFCLNTAGNEVSALAMYNAGTSRVRSNKTPQSTLNYVGKILSYQKMLDQLFSEQVTAYFETQLVPGISVAMADNSKHK